jgi:hypothetical protein
MFQNASSQSLWQATVWIGLGTAAVTVLLLIGLFALKWAKQRQAHKEAEFQTFWQPLLMACALEDKMPATIPALRKEQEWLFIKLWVRLQATLRGAPNERLRQLGQHMGCALIARKLLASHHKSEKVFGLMALAYMHDEADWPLLRPYLQQSGNTVAVYASIGLLKINPEQAAPLVIDQLLQRPDIDLINASSVFKPFRQHLHVALGNHIVEASKCALQRPTGSSTETAIKELTWLFKVAHALDMHISTGVLMPFLQAQQPIDWIIGALRLLKVPDALPAVRELAQHSAWEIRNQVCLTLSKMGDASDVPLLTQLLMDPQWWVRYRAAQALISLPFVAHDDLKKLIASLPDRYARDMAEQAFAESWPSS